MLNNNALLLLTATTFILMGCSDSEKQANNNTVRPAKLMQINLVKEKLHHFPGEVQASQKADLAFRVHGQLQTLAVYAGEQVTKGQLLAELDPTDYQLAVNMHQARFDLAKVQHTRSEKLIGDFLISQDQFDQSYTTLQIAGANLDSAKSDLLHTKIYAPYDGIISAKYLTEFEAVQAQQPVMSLQSVNAIDINIQIPEYIIAAIQRMQKSGKTIQPMASFPVNPNGQYPATYKEISTVADRDTGSFSVTLTMTQPQEINLFPGMAANISAPLLLSANELNQRIPDAALINSQQVWRYVPQSNSIELVDIVLDNDQRLISGLNDGDRIVAAGARELSANQKIIPWVREKGL